MRVTELVWFETVTVIAADVEVLPAPSRAVAVSVCDPSLAAAVFQVAEYGAVVLSAPSATPSRKNCTPVTATLSEALAVTVIAALTVAPLAGEVIATVGATESLTTVTVTLAEVAVLPAASRATAVSTFDPPLAVVVSQLTA